MRPLLFVQHLLPVVVLAAFPATAQAGLFDFLLPAAPQQRTLEMPDYPDLPPVAMPRRHVEEHRHIVVVHKKAVDKPLELGQRSAAVSQDTTLREGDAIMTQNGIRVFAGSSSGEHRASDFATLSETKGLSPAEHQALAEIDAKPADETATKTASLDAPVTGRSSSNTALAWKWVRDPKGHLVRYVGP